MKKRMATTTEQKTKLITIFVNDNPVEMDSRLVTGLQIKNAAKVPIDSTLYRLRGQERMPVGDNEQIEIHEGERFLDVPGGNVS